MRSDDDGRKRGQLCVAFSAIAISFAGVLQRELSLDTATQVAGRACFAAIALAAFLALGNRGNLLRAFTSIGRGGAAVVACAAAASASFIVALNHATVASVLFIQAVAPIAAGLIAWIVLSERPSRASALAMSVGLGGVAVMVGGPGTGFGIGQLLALVMTLLTAILLVITRHKRDVSMTPAICLAQVIVCDFFAPFSHPTSVRGRDLALLVALGVGMGIGVVFLTAGARLIPPADVALISLLDVVLGPLWVWLLRSEQPNMSTLLGGTLVLVAVAVLGLRQPSAGFRTTSTRRSAAQLAFAWVAIGRSSDCRRCEGEH